MRKIRRAIVSSDNSFTGRVMIEGTGIVRMQTDTSGTATIIVQSSNDDGSNWITEQTLTEDGTYTFDGLSMEWRVGCATGGYTDGTYELSIGEDG